MSGFEDNFSEQTVDNPFADPAIQQATRMTSNVSLEDYNPFEEQTKPQLQINSSNNVAVVQPLSQNATLPAQVANAPAVHTGTITAATAPPINTATNTAIKVTTEELQRRQEELDRKAAELDRREQQIQGNVPHLNNWPPMPDNFCLKPCFYQDFNLDIPPEFQKLVKHLYYTWMFYAMTLCINVIGSVLVFLHNGDIGHLFLSIIYCALCTPMSYVCWFRPAYKAFRNDSSFNFMVFFIVYFLQTLYIFVQVIGMRGSGYCGFVTALSEFDSSPVGIIIGLLLLCVATCFALSIVANAMMITKIHTIYRSTGASLAKAQVEFTTEFMRNQHVQQAASSAVSSALNSSHNNSRY